MSHIQYHIGIDWSFQIGDVTYPVFYIGQSSFPIFVYLSAYGFGLTSSKINFIKRLLIYGTIIQIPLFILGFSYINIFITLGLGLLAVYAIESLNVMLVFPILIFAYFTDLDYGIYGIVLMLLAYYFRYKVWAYSLAIVILQYLWISEGWFPHIQWFSVVAIPLLLMYNGELGYRKLKWFFYIYYPLHVAIIVYIANYVL